MKMYTPDFALIDISLENHLFGILFAILVSVNLFIEYQKTEKQTFDSTTEVFWDM